MTTTAIAILTGFTKHETILLKATVRMLESLPIV